MSSTPKARQVSDISSPIFDVDCFSPIEVDCRSLQTGMLQMNDVVRRCTSTMEGRSCSWIVKWFAHLMHIAPPPSTAQTMTNPGNLFYYRLGNERFDEWSALKSHDPGKKAICGEIIDAIEAKGGVFRSKTGGVLSRLAAENKTKDRMRQIAKPKLRPTGFGEDDVVFATGEFYIMAITCASSFRRCYGFNFDLILADVARHP